ncbi:MAG: radical SAM protein, partial [Candidatus Margulisiibacteriota bacterium]
TRHPLNEFDAIGFCLSYELSYTNVLNMLDLAGIPLESENRGEGDPLIFGGGHAAFNPDPIADFFDFFIIGEAEEVLIEVADVLCPAIIPPSPLNTSVPINTPINTIPTNQSSPLSRKEILSRLAKIEGVYVPSLKNKTKKRVIKDLDNAYFQTKPLVPFLDTVQNRASLEIMRGCSNRCRFCQAGYVSLPRRERKVDTLVRQARDLLRNTGYEELGLLSLSSSDYSTIEELVCELDRVCRKKHVSLSLPSLRVDKLQQEVMDIVQKSGRSGLTLAPEAGTQRLRDLMNKNITEEDIINAVKTARASGAKAAKLYFMIGLPGETNEDINGLVDLVYKLRGYMPITVSVSNFIPKPHTPFQWERQIGMAEIKQKQAFLRSSIKGRNLKFRWHDARLSVLEGVFARGDRSLGKVIKLAWEKGCRFDAWDEQFQWDTWLAVLGYNGEENDNNAGSYDQLFEKYLRARDYDEELPWDLIDIGISKDRLREECGLRPEVVPNV